MKKVWDWIKENWAAVLNAILWGVPITGLILGGIALFAQFFQKCWAANAWLGLVGLAAMFTIVVIGTYKAIKKPEAAMVVYSKNISFNQIDRNTTSVEIGAGSTDKKFLEKNSDSSKE